MPIHHSIVRRVEVDAQNIFWSPTSTLVALTTKDAFYILRFDRQAYDNAHDTEAEIGDEGVEEAFEVVAEINEVVKTAKWIEECFVYTTANGSLNYLVGNESFTVTNLDGPKYLLGYIPANSKIYLTDKDMNVFAYPLSIHLIEYQTAILRKDVPPEELEAMLEKVPKEMWGRVARFLEGRGLKQEALKITPDATHKFDQDLALQLDDLPTAISIASSIPAPESDTNWKAIGDRALALWRFDLAGECFAKAGDLSALMMLAMGDKAGLERVANAAAEKGQNNLAFAAMLQLGNPKSCVDLLMKTDRPAEAALFARTYVPSYVPTAVMAWKSSLETAGRSKLADQIAVSEEHSELFEGYKKSLEREKLEGRLRTQRTTAPA